MKHISILAMSVILMAPVAANAASVSPLHASGIITNNIVSMQHSIILNAFDKFGSETNMGTYSEYKTPKDTHEKCPPVYGQMLTYGEYGDDGTVFASGHSGGELAESNYNWFDWQHAWGTAKFKDFDKIDSRYDLISMGFSNEPVRIDNGFSQFGGFGGLIISKESSDAVSTSEAGGFLGLYKGYNLHGFNITAAGNLGLLFSDAHATPGDYDFTNFWLGMGLNASYDIKLANSFVLQPGIYGGYTWIHSSAYQSSTGATLSIDGLNKFEASPSLRAILMFGSGWYGTLSGRYVFNFSSGGDVKSGGVTVPELELMNYAEYGLAIEKNSDRLGVGLSLNRRSGGLTGWVGGLHIKYVF